MGHVVQKKWDFIDKSVTKTFWDIKLTEDYYIFNFVILYCSMFSPTQKLLWSVQVEATCIELQFNLQDRRAHSVGSLS